MVTGGGLLGQLSAHEEALLAELDGHRPRLKASTCPDLHFITDYPGAGVERRRVFNAVAKLVDEADEAIFVETPYLVLRSDGAEVMRAVTRRGAKLTFLTNSLYSTDAFYTVANLADSLEMLKLPGVEVWAYKGQPLRGSARPPASQRWGVHSKRAVVDNDTVVIGTYNIDPRSANLNSELIVICRGNEALAAEVKASQQARLAQSVAITGTADAGGYNALIDGADGLTVWKMRMSAPFADFLDFLL